MRKKRSKRCGERQAKRSPHLDHPWTRKRQVRMEFSSITSLERKNTYQDSLRLLLPRGKLLKILKSLSFFLFLKKAAEMFLIVTEPSLSGQSFQTFFCGLLFRLAERLQSWQFSLFSSIVQNTTVRTIYLSCLESLIYAEPQGTLYFFSLQTSKKHSTRYRESFFFTFWQKDALKAGFNPYLSSSKCKADFQKARNDCRQWCSSGGHPCCNPICVGDGWDNEGMRKQKGKARWN